MTNTGDTKLVALSSTKETQMFYHRDNLYFGRCKDGFVRIVKFETSNGRTPHALLLHNERAVTGRMDYPHADGEFQSVKVVFDVRIHPSEWASIIATVSASGESSHQYIAAQKFHSQLSETP